MTMVTFTEFRKRASGLISEVEKGSVLVIVRHGKPVAAISPYGEGQTNEPAWKKPGLRLSTHGVALSKAIREEREIS